jgi:hypothetical protein
MDRMNLAPIVLFVYNRLEPLKQTIKSLQKNELANNSELFIFSDEAENENIEFKVSKVREYIKKVSGFKKVVVFERKKNWGLANSIIDGVTKIVNKYGRIIVLEDDLVTSPYFLRFMNEALEMYKDDPKIASIHGYIYPIKNLPDTFFIKGADCWGWATWKNKWSIFEEDGKKLLDQIKKKNIKRDVDFNNSYGYTKMLKDQIEGKNNSWAVRWYISAFLKNKLTLYPGQSYVQNIGFGDDATHCKTEADLFKINLNNQYKLLKITSNEDLISKKKIENYFKSINKSFYQKLKFKITKFIK